MFKRKILITGARDGTAEIVVLTPPDAKPRDAADIMRIIRGDLLNASASRLAALQACGAKEALGELRDFRVVELRSLGTSDRASLLMDERIQAIAVAHMEPRLIFEILLGSFQAADWVSGEQAGCFIAVGEW